MRDWQPVRDVKAVVWDLTPVGGRKGRLDLSTRKTKLFDRIVDYDHTLNQNRRPGVPCPSPCPLCQEQAREAAAAAGTTAQVVAVRKRGPVSCFDSDGSDSDGEEASKGPGTEPRTKWSVDVDSSDSDSDGEEASKGPVAKPRMKICASDTDDSDSDGEKASKGPVPKPRTTPKGPVAEPRTMLAGEDVVIVIKVDFGPQRGQQPCCGPPQCWQSTRFCQGAHSCCLPTG